MVSFTKFSLILLGFGLFLLIVIENPLHYKPPELIKNYMDMNDPNKKNTLDLFQLESAAQNPTLCFRHADCVLTLCGKAPNCHSFATNTQFINNTIEEVPESYRCPDPEELMPNDCGQTYFLDAYAACEEGHCVIKRTFSEEPLPEHILLDAATK
jgi:hypothetical protein